MRVVVTGATGLVGLALARALRDRGDEVVALTRNPDSALGKLGADVEIHGWADPQGSSLPTAALTRADAVVHLAGEPVAQRWTRRAKRAISDSRFLSTRQLVGAPGALPADQRPAVLVSPSRRPATTARAPRSARGRGWRRRQRLPGRGNARMAREARGAPDHTGIRVVITCTGVVLSPRGGALAKMLPPLRLGLGGPVAAAGGTCRGYTRRCGRRLLRCLDDQRIEGPGERHRPESGAQSELAKTLGRVLGGPRCCRCPRRRFGSCTARWRQSCSPVSGWSPDASCSSGTSSASRAWSPRCGTRLGAREHAGVLRREQIVPTPRWRGVRVLPRLHRPRRRHAYPGSGSCSRGSFE